MMTFCKPRFPKYHNRMQNLQHSSSNLVRLSITQTSLLMTLKVAPEKKYPSLD